MEKYKTILIVAIVIMIISAITTGVMLKKDNKNENKTTNTNYSEIEKKDNNEESNSEEITIVPTMSDKITKNSAWCATFQLVWNDMKNEVVKKDIEFDPQIEMAENLNKEEFTEDMLSDEYYYKVWGLKTLDLKNEIEQGIMEKFNEKSDILDMIDWSEDALDNPQNPYIRRYIFYSMLKRNFEFLNEFDELGKSTFGKNETSEYFGINKNTDNKVRNQIDILFYNSEDDFAVILNTKQNDQVILYKNEKGENFNEIYNDLFSKTANYTESRQMRDNDELKVPKIKFNKINEYEELEDKKFETDEGEGKIYKAIQSIEFELDKTGGKIKSEATIDVEELGAGIEVKKEPRYFYFDDSFTLFLQEKGKPLPYFAANIGSIKQFQD